MTVMTEERIAVWQQAVIDGRRRVADVERRETYPANPDEDTLTLAEHYRLKWHQARILKALSFFVDIRPHELSAVTGVHPALMTMEVRRVAERTRMRVETVRRQDGVVSLYRLMDAADRDEIRAVICSNWRL